MNEFAKLLTALGRDDEERLSLSGIEGGKRRYKLTTVGEAKRAPLDSKSDRYYGVAALGAHVEDGRGKARDVIGVREVYLDLDVKDGGMPTEEAAIDVIAELSDLIGPPTVVVHTGHGLQPHWPVQRDGDTDWPDASDERWVRVGILMKRWHRLAASVAAKHGGKLDNVSDLSRVLRVPGTTNRKVAGQPVGVTAEYLDEGQPVSLDRLATVLDDAGVTELDTDRPATGAVVSVPEDWSWAAGTCAYAATMVDGWGTDAPPGGRHQWLLAQAVRLAAGHRSGCLTEHGHRLAVESLETRFAALVGSTSPMRSPAPGEVAGALDWGVGLVSGMTEEAARKELGGHEHTEAVGVDSLSEEWFWTSRERLARLRAYARAAKVSPWAMFGATLAIVASRISPKVVLPPLGDSVLARTGRGGVGSLNIFVGNVGLPGSGKDMAGEAAEAFLWLDDADLLVVKLGTGQGIAAQYTRQRAKNEGGGTVQFNDTCLFTAREVDTLAAHADMGGSNLLATLKDCYTGAELGEGYAKLENRRPVGKNQYRAVLVCGIQPSHAGVILDDADGGFPQRWLWFMATDPNRPKGGGEDQGDILTANWTPPRDLAPQGTCDPHGVVPIRPSDRVVLEVCQIARDEGEAGREEGLDGTEGGGLDSHAHFTQRKVAALLSIFDDRRGDVSEEDWKLAEVVMAHSRMARAVCERAVAAKAQTLNRSRAVAEGQRRAIAAGAEAEVVDQSVTQASRRVLAALERAKQRDEEEWVTASKLKRTAMKSAERPYFDQAVAGLAEAGLIEVEEFEYKGQPAKRYRVAPVSK